VPRRRLAADGATQRLASGAAGSLARYRWSHCRAVMVAERTRVPPTAIRFGVPAASWCQDVRCPLCLARPVSVLRQCPRVQRPPVQRPASGACPASACPVSARLCPIPRCPCPVSRARVRRRVSGVRCERPASRACRACVRPIRTGDVVEREGAAGSHASRTGAVGVSPTVFATSSPAAQVEVWCLELAALAAAASAGPPAAVVEALGWWPGSTAWPTGTRRLRAGSPVCRAASARRFAHWDRLRAGRQERAVGVLPATT
jgi:hypothetical protein